MSENSWPYWDILDKPYPESVELPKPRMQKQDRAAQFAPFAALTGHEEVLQETARLAAGRKTVTAEAFYEDP